MSCCVHYNPCRYSSNQIFGVILVTIGIVTLTLAEGAQKSVSASCINCGNVLPNVTSTAPSPILAQNFTTGGLFDMYNQMMENPFLRWLCGIGMLTIALFLSSGLGHLQVECVKYHVTCLGLAIFKIRKELARGNVLHSRVGSSLLPVSHE